MPAPPSRVARWMSASQVRSERQVGMRLLADLSFVAFGWGREERPKHYVLHVQTHKAMQIMLCGMC